MAKDLNGIRGSCLCGEVTFVLKGSAEIFHMCHCSRCRKSTGSAHASNIIAPPDNIEWLSGEENIRRFKLPEAKYFTKTFCATCGSLVPRVTRGGTRLVIPAGSLTSKISFAPDDNICWASRAEWYEAGRDSIKYDEFHPGRTF